VGADFFQNGHLRSTLIAMKKLMALIVQTSVHFLKFLNHTGQVVC
jgi:hypothetical protein